jgi:peptidyl-prolyl cis-trans isomerase A (cyclophilin A)
MHPFKRGISLILVTFVGGLTVSPRNADATIVEFQTVMGNFQVNLYDNATPATVANFLNYVNNGAYTSSIIHRSEPGFVIQGGGVTYDVVTPLISIPTNPAVVNEPRFSNVGATIAMAKAGGDPNSATSQYFFNLTNNSANLDGNNGGFTVFGEVVPNGMDVINAIAALPRYNLGASIGNAGMGTVPLRSYVTGAPLDETNLVIVTAISISDTTIDSAAGLNPPLNNANSGGGGGGGSVGGGGGGGGALGLFALFGLLLMQGLRRRA